MCTFGWSFKSGMNGKLYRLYYLRAHGQKFILDKEFFPISNNCNYYFEKFLQVFDYEGEYHTFVDGKNSYEKAGFIANVNNETYLPYYKAPCNRLAGASDGKKFGNNVDPKEKLYIYNRLFCRTIALVRTILIKRYDKSRYSRKIRAPKFGGTDF